MTNWKKVFMNNIADYGFISRIYKGPSKLNSKKQTKNPIRKWTKDIKRRFQEEALWTANEHRKKCSTFLAIRKCKLTMRYDYNELRLHTY